MACTLFTQQRTVSSVSRLKIHLNRGHAPPPPTFPLPKNHKIPFLEKYYFTRPAQFFYM